MQPQRGNKTKWLWFHVSSPPDVQRCRKPCTTMTDASYVRSNNDTSNDIDSVPPWTRHIVAFWLFRSLSMLVRLPRSSAHIIQIRNCVDSTQAHSGAPRSENRVDPLQTGTKDCYTDTLHRTGLSIGEPTYPIVSNPPVRSDGKDAPSNPNAKQVMRSSSFRRAMPPEVLRGSRCAGASRTFRGQHTCASILRMCGRHG